MKSKILIPTDLSEKSKNSVFYGTHLAEKLDKEIILFHVSDIYGYGMAYPFPSSVPSQMPTAIIEQNEEESKKQFEAFCSDIKQRISTGVTLRCVRKKGFIVDKILEEIQEEYVDTIILTRREKSSDISDITEKIINEAPCPVWVIPPKVTYRPFHRIVYATDYNEHDIATIEKLITLAKLYDSRIYALHICESISFRTELQARGFEAMVHEQTGYEKFESVLIPGENKITRIIEAFAQEAETDLLVVLKENETFWEGIFNSSTTKKLVFQAELPVLVYRET